MVNNRLAMADIPNLTLEEAQEYIDVFSDEAGKIDGDLRAAKAKLVASGSYADPSWYQAAYNAMKQKRRLVMRLQQHVKQLKREQWQAEHRADVESCVDERLQKHLAYADQFIYMAKVILTEEAFNRIDEAARELCK